MLGDHTVTKSGNSSLPLQIFVFFSYHYTFFFFFINLGLFTYKSASYYYPARYLAWDIVIIFIYALVDGARLLLLSKGNKTTKVAPLVLSFILSLPLFVVHAYYIDLQTYVLRVDVVINAIAFFFLSCESLASIYMMIALRLAATRF